MEEQIKQLLLQAQSLQIEVEGFLNDNLQQQLQQQQQQQENEQRFLESSSKNSLNFDSGDTAWMMFATILVYMMTTPGIMLYYAGLVRLQNVLSTTIQGFSIACVITFLWLCFGYSLAFAPVNNSHESTLIFGNAERFWLLGLKPTTSHQIAPHIPESLFCAYELAFAIITPSLICGAFADRMKFNSMLLSLGLWHLIVYCPIAHIHWHPDGFLNKAGVIDYAGGNVVHVSAGFSSLLAAIVIGQRTGFGKTSFHPHNLLVSITGACFLWLGWYGFNAGSGFHANEAAGIAMLNSMIASAVASITWMFIDLLTNGRASIIGIMNGAIAGLVAITPAAGYVPISGAFVIGVVGGIGVSRGVLVKDYFEFDDALDAFGVHAIGGVIGTLMVGLFAKEEIGGYNGAFYGDPKQLGLQIYSIVVTAGWSSFGTWVIMNFVDILIGLRVSTTKEEKGLDRSLHGSTMYSLITEVPQRKIEEEKRKGRTPVIKRLREKTTANDNSLDVVEDRVIRVPKGRHYGDIETTDRENGNSSEDYDHGNLDFMEQNESESNETKTNEDNRNTNNNNSNSDIENIELTNSTNDKEQQHDQQHEEQEQHGKEEQEEIKQEHDPENGYGTITNQNIQENI